MVSKKYVDFVTVLGEEYIKVTAHLVQFGPDLLDGYRIFATIFRPDGITPERLSTVSELELDQIRATACHRNGSTQITAQHICEVIDRTLARWAADPGKQVN